MAEYSCPQCHAEIHADLIETTGQAECPFCGADLSSLGLPAPAESTVTPAEQFVPASETASVRQDLPSLPAKSRITIVEASAERLVFYVPGGGAASGGIGCFALVWNGFMVAFTSIILTSGGQGAGNNPTPELGLIAFLSLFWAVGLGMAYFWMRLKFERTFLLLERQRIVLQKVLFSRKRVEETILTTASRAELVESYKQNDRPVYRIEVQGQDRAVKFGTSLSDAEKDWLVDRINEFLNVSGNAVISDGSAPLAEINSAGDGSVAPGLAEPPIPPGSDAGLEPGSLPSDSPIRVEEDSPDVLRFGLAAAQNPVAKWCVAGFMLLFSLIWYGFTLSSLLNIRHNPVGPHTIIELLFSLPFVVVGLVPLGFALMALFGVITVSLTRETLSCRWSVGPFGWTKRLPTAAISQVRVESGDNQNLRTRQPSRVRRNQVTQRACIVWAGEKRMPLTLLHDDEVMVQVAALVRTRLQDLGFKLRDV